MKSVAIGVTALILIAVSVPLSGSLAINDPSRWNEKYDFLAGVSPITFHFDHGVLAGSYPPGRETTTVTFDDVSGYLGHVCLCGAGGYRISQIAVAMLGDGNAALEKGEFVLVSNGDNTVADVIAFVLGCCRRNNPEKNQYFVDESIEAPKREYHFFIGYPPLRKAIHIIYRKHLLIGNEMMDKLWRIETAFEENPDSVSREDLALYQKTMVEMVRQVLLGTTTGLFETATVDYSDFLSRLNGLRRAAR
jgi:hypothetical protein